MTSFTDIFGGTPVNPAQLTYNAFSISANTALVWPWAATTTPIIAQIMEVTATTTGLSLSLPDATEGSTGYAFYIHNTGSNTFTVENFTSGTVQAVTAGQVFIIWNQDNSTQAGQWFSGQVTASVIAPNAAALAGAGLKAISTTLNWNLPPNEQLNNYAMSQTDRATAITNIGGTVIYTMPSPATVGSGWIVAVKNAGTGTITVNPSSSESIDGTTTIILLSEESTFLITDGTNWYTIGRGRSLTYSISRLALPLPSTGTYTLTSTQAANQMLYFTGSLSGTVNVVVPTSVQIYYITNATSGGQSIFVKTSSGTGVYVNNGLSLILACDGTNVYNPETGNNPGGTVSMVGTGAGLTGGPITSTGTISLASTGVVSGTYGDQSDVPVLTLNMYGQVINATSTAILVNTANIANGAVGTAQLAAGAVTSTNIANGAVGTTQIANGAVTGTQIASSVALAGSPTTTTQSSSDNSTKIATTAMVQSAISGSSVFTKYYVSSPLAITSGGNEVLVHGLGAIPKLIQLYLVNVTTEGGYASGSYMFIPITQNTVSYSQGVGLTSDSTAITVRYSSTANAFSGVNIVNGNLFNITNANWNLVVQAWA